MTPERWRRVEELFQTALDLAPAERPQYIERACASDPKLRDEVEATLARSIARTSHACWTTFSVRDPR